MQFLGETGHDDRLVGFLAEQAAKDGQNTEAIDPIRAMRVLSGQQFVTSPMLSSLRRLRPQLWKMRSSGVRLTPLRHCRASTSRSPPDRSATWHRSSRAIGSCQRPHLSYERCSANSATNESIHPVVHSLEPGLLAPCVCRQAGVDRVLGNTAA
jgi:hypothetical protein